MVKSYLEQPNEGKAEQKKLKQSIEFILEECRMVLPGIQALFGFQLIAVFNENFHTLTNADKYVHLAAIMFTVGAVGLLMGPASYHRLTSPESVPAELCKIGTRLVCSGMALLMVSISLEIYLVTKVISESMAAGIISSVIAFLFLGIIWYAYPLTLGRRNRHFHTETPTML